MDSRINAKVSKLWPAHVGEALAVLAEYSGLEANRVRLAALRLCDGTLDSLRRCIEASNTDYRDVLAWAESPREMKAGAGPWPMTLEQQRARRRIREADHQEYTNWLASD